VCEPQRELGRVVVFIYKGKSSTTAESKLVVICSSGGLTSSLARQLFNVNLTMQVEADPHAYADPLRPWAKSIVSDAEMAGSLWQRLGRPSFQECHDAHRGLCQVRGKRETCGKLNL